MRININLNYEVSSDISDISLNVDEGYDGCVSAKYMFSVIISFEKQKYEITAFQWMCFFGLQPPAPAEDIFPESDIDMWRFTSYPEGRMEIRDFSELNDIEKKIMEAAVDKICNDKAKIKQAYIKFWTDHAQDAKKSALQALKRAEKLQEKIDGFLETLNNM
jgi:hypothetical protein